MCGSSKGNFDPTWKFPNGTNVLTHNSAAVQQADKSLGYKELRLNSPNFIVQNGDYICTYIVNGAIKMKRISIVFNSRKTTRHICVVNFDCVCIL